MKYDEGIPLGKLMKDEHGKYKHALYNHWLITVKTQPVENSLHMRIVGFEVEPRSYRPEDPVTLTWNKHTPLYLEDLKKGDKQTFSFTYSIQSVVDNETMWASRMEHYLKFGNENIHLAAILLSLAIIITLTCIISKVMQRSLNKDVVTSIKSAIGAKERRQERARLPSNDEPEARGLT